MKFLVKYLKHIANSKDIRVENSKMMQLESLLKKLDEKRSIEAESEIISEELKSCKLLLYNII